MKNINITFCNYNGKKHELNRNIIVEKNLNVLTIIKILNLHELKNKFCLKMKKTDNPKLLYIFGQLIKTIEFKLQELWRFPQDESYHEFYNLPKCKCPKLDNYDLKGVKNAHIISENCPVHNEFFKK